MSSCTEYGASAREPKHLMLARPRDRRVRGVILARQRDGDLILPHFDLPNVGGDQLHIIDRRIVSNVPAVRSGRI
jgi:hypothetical protein